MAFDANSPTNHEPRTPTHETTHALGIDREQYASGPS
jgi:hypothetical protein